jgi:hypothetical protein
MNGSRWARWDYVSGVIFVVLFIVSFAVAGDPGGTPTKVEAFYADSGNRNKQFLAFFLFLAGLLAFLWFLGALRRTLLRAEGEPGTFTALAFGSGLVSAALMLGAIAMFVAPAGAGEDKDFKVVGDTVNVVQSAGYVLLVSAVVMAAWLALGTSLVALRTLVLPRWFAWFGVAAAVAMLFGVFFIPLFAFPLWVLVLSVVMLTQAWRPPARPMTTSGVG